MIIFVTHVGHQGRGFNPPFNRFQIVLQRNAYGEWLGRPELRRRMWVR